MISLPPRLTPVQTVNDPAALRCVTGMFKLANLKVEAASAEEMPGMTRGSSLCARKYRTSSPARP